MRTCHKLYSTYERKKRTSAEGSLCKSLDIYQSHTTCIFTVRGDFHHCLEEMAGTVPVAQLDFGLAGIVGTVAFDWTRIVLGEPVLVGTAPADIAVVHMLAVRSAVDHRTVARSAAGRIAVDHIAAGRRAVGHIAVGRTVAGHRVAVHIVADRTAAGHRAAHKVVHTEHHMIVLRQHTGHCWRRPNKADRKYRRRPSAAQDRHHVDHMRRGTPKAS